VITASAIKKKSASIPKPASHAVRPRAAADATFPASIVQGGIMDQSTFQDCIDACNRCAQACDNCAASCLREEDVKAMARCIALDMDCAQVCRTAAALMARGSDHAAALCRVCETVCRACAAECG
jgi:hypothetical protein